MGGTPWCASQNGFLDVNTANEICIIIPAGQIANDDTAAPGRGGVDVFSVAHIDAYMGAGLARIAAGIIEKHQVTGLQSILSLIHI